MTIMNTLYYLTAIASESYIVYIAQFYYKYTITDGITDFATCSQIYRNQLESKYPTLIQSFTNLCNQNSQSNPFTLSVGEYTISSLQYEGNTVSRYVLLYMFIAIWGKAC